MTKEQIMVKLFEFSAPTYYKWTKKEKRKIFDLLNYAFTLEELEEFITTGKINKIENINNNESSFEELDKFMFELTKVSNSFIAKNIINTMKEHFVNHNYKINFEDLIYEIFSLNNYYFIECADEDFFLEINDFEMKYNRFTNSVNTNDATIDTILLMKKSKIINLIQTTAKDFLDLLLNKLCKK